MQYADEPEVQPVDVEARRLGHWGLR
jgi:hypothetical protein